MLERVEWLLGLGGTKRDVAFLGVSAVALVMSLAGVEPLPFPVAWVAIVLCGVPIVTEAVIGLVTEFDVTADVLVSLALVASVAIGETFAAGEVALIMQLGGLLEELTVARARAGIERLVNLTPRTARIVDDAGERVVAAEEVPVGAVVRVLPGETVPVDGTVVAGETSVDQAIMTGESLPQDKAPGDEVSSGTVNQYGSIDVRAERVGEDSSIQRMVRLVQSADASKAKIVGLADRWAVWIVAIALVAAGVTWAVTGQIIRAVTILVVFCPCALVLATPTAIMAAIGNASRHGFLVREDGGVDVTPELAALADAQRSLGATAVLVAVGGRAAGVVALADTLREDARRTVRAVADCGVEPVLLTGDHAAAAAHVADELGIASFRAECLPEDKLAWIEASEAAGRPVCMVGDGVNDAPALRRAMVGIAMGGVGSDIAVDAADIALVSDDIAELPHLLRLSRRMMTTIKINLTFSMTLNFVAITLAILGVLDPVVGALVHNAGSVLVIVNSALLLGWRARRA